MPRAISKCGGKKLDVKPIDFYRSFPFSIITSVDDDTKF